MYKAGQKIRVEGRICEIMAPVMTIPISYLVEFKDTGESRIVMFKGKQAQERDPAPEPKKPAQGVGDIFDGMFESMFKRSAKQPLTSSPTVENPTGEDKTISPDIDPSFHKIVDYMIGVKTKAEHFISPEQMQKHFPVLTAAIQRLAAAGLINTPAMNKTTLALYLMVVYFYIRFEKGKGYDPTIAYITEVCHQINKDLEIEKVIGKDEIEQTISEVHRKLQEDYEREK